MPLSLTGEGLFFLYLRNAAVIGHLNRVLRVQNKQSRDSGKPLIIKERYERTKND
jgi:hypothetical protein